MNEEARRIKNQYFREWRKKNPEKVKQIQDRYWEKKAEENNQNKIKK